RLARRAVTIIDSRAQRILRYRACFGGLEKTPRLAESEALAVPATLGVLRPIVLLPADWREWDDAKLDAVLAHEISHVARRDALTQRLSLIHRVVFWFSPLSWWINHQIAELAEEASDEAALAGGADRTHYAETLLGFFAELEATHGRIYWQGVSMANGLRAARRVDRILSWNGAISMKRWLIAAIVALAVPVIFVAGSARPFIAHAQDETKPKVAVPPAVPAPAPAPATQGVVAPALPSAPSGPGVIAPAPMGQSPATPTPVVAPVPGAPLHPPLVPGPIAPGALSSPAPMARPAIAPMGQSPRAAFPGMAPMVPMAGQTPMAAAAPTPPPKFDFQFQMPPGPRAQQSNTIVNGEFDSYSGPRYVIMTANSDSVTMSGSEEDLDHARKIQKKVGGDVIWFERDEKSYLITDPAFIAKAKALFAPEEALSKQEDDLGRQQDALGKQQDALGAKMDAVKVKVPDIAPELQRVKAELDALRASGGTQSDLGRIQSEIGRLQSDIGRYQSDAGVQQSEIGRQQGELGRQQGELGRKQGESGRQEGEIARKASRQLRDMFDDAIAKGIAKPE
ncbi:MAG: M56 family metallopeptidase, partial [Candidatus Acidiferrales bacterium]